MVDAGMGMDTHTGGDLETLRMRASLAERRLADALFRIDTIQRSAVWRVALRLYTVLALARRGVRAVRGPAIAAIFRLEVWARTHLPRLRGVLVRMPVCRRLYSRATAYTPQPPAQSAMDIAFKPFFGLDTAQGGASGAGQGATPASFRLSPQAGDDTLSTLQALAQLWQPVKRLR